MSPLPRRSHELVEGAKVGVFCLPRGAFGLEYFLVQQAFYYALGGGLNEYYLTPADAKPARPTSTLSLN